MADFSGADPAGHTTFRWHPAYAGRSADDVRRELAEEIARDQRAYELALEGAEQSEHASLSSVMEIEKRWSMYSFDWADTEPQALAARIVAFELERERRRELFPFAEFRERERGTGAPGAPSTGGAPGDDAGRRRAVTLGLLVVLVSLGIIVLAIVLAVL